MEFENIDWDAEAKRVGRAFGVQGRCWFEDNDWYWFLQSEPAIDSQRGRGMVPLASGLIVECHYSRVNRYFAIVEAGEKELVYTGVTLDWNGHIRQTSVKQSRAIELAAALFRLGLLTLEVETALGVNVSAHEKMEWLLVASG